MSYQSLMPDAILNEWHSMSDYALTAHIGVFVKHHRLEQNKTQDVLSHEAGISPLALAKAELEKRKRARNTKTQDPEKSDW
jgi:hypothetical protein